MVAITYRAETTARYEAKALKAFAIQNMRTATADTVSPYVYAAAAFLGALAGLVWAVL